MTDGDLHILDASAGVKWFKLERGSDSAAALYRRASNGEIDLAAPVHFVHEVLSVVQRELSVRAIPESWRHLKASGITFLPLTDEIVDEAANQCELLDCSFYDALAPACAVLLGATLVSADVRAHGGFPGVFLIE